MAVQSLQDNGLCVTTSSRQCLLFTHLCRYFHKEGLKGEESLEQIVPTLSEFCDYVEK